MWLADTWKVLAHFVRFFLYSEDTMKEVYTNLLENKRLQGGEQSLPGYQPLNHQTCEGGQFTSFIRQLTY